MRLRNGFADRNSGSFHSLCQEVLPSCRGYGSVEGNTTESAGGKTRCRHTPILQHKRGSTAHSHSYSHLAPASRRANGMIPPMPCWGSFVPGGEKERERMPCNIMSWEKCSPCRFCTERMRDGIVLVCRVHSGLELHVVSCPMEGAAPEEKVQGVGEEGVVPATEKKRRGRKPSITTDKPSAKPKGRVATKPRAADVLPVV